MLDCKKLIDNSVNWTLLPTREYIWSSNIDIQSSGEIITSDGIYFDVEITDDILTSSDGSLDVTKCRIENVQIIVSTSGASKIHELDLRIKSPDVDHTVSCFNSEVISGLNSKSINRYFSISGMFPWRKSERNWKISFKDVNLNTENKITNLELKIFGHVLP